MGEPSPWAPWRLMGPNAKIRAIGFVIDDSEEKATVEGCVLSTVECIVNQLMSKVTQKDVRTRGYSISSLSLCLASLTKEEDLCGGSSLSQQTSDLHVVVSANSASVENLMAVLAKLGISVETEDCADNENASALSVKDSEATNRILNV